MTAPHAHPKHTNRLAGETSPYLLQHAHNPVDWYPWGPDPLERAKREDKPILLSIGYAACHWCHVMERESFEDEATAQLMNEHFVCIKVDREERPDLDDVYMAATVALSGSGGWPMTVFLTPEQKPFFAGTYFPPEGRYGRPGFPTLLRRIAELWKTDRARLLEHAEELTEHVRMQSAIAAGAGIGDDAIEGAVHQLSLAFDPRWGGFGNAPKFPPSAALRLLLRRYRKHKDTHALTMAEKTLAAMKNGGMYDHVGGGFARYSTDERWLVPHFEKMLYDNAQLARVYVEAWQATGNAEYRRVATETLDYVAREMQSSEGGYYSATDADSEGEEGKFFVWRPEEIEAIAGQPDAERFCRYYDITAPGNWEGKSIPNTPRTPADVADRLGIPPGELMESVERARAKVYAARAQRVPPLTDDKVLTSWNALMIGAMAEAHRALREPKYLASGERAAAFIFATLVRPDGGLYRTARAGKAHLDAYLEDYAFLADALLDLYEAGASPRWLERALAIAERMIRDFGDDGSGAFFQTAHGHEALLVRTREGHDGALPNANAVAARALARLGAHFDRADLRDRAEQALRAYGQLVSRAPRAFATSLAVVDFLRSGPAELVFAGARDDAATEALWREAGRVYLPNRIVGHVDPAAPVDVGVRMPLVESKGLVGGKPALYVCRNFSCAAPITDPAAVGSALDAAVT